MERGNEMKNMTKKIFSLLIVFAICLSVTIGINLPTSAASYVYNWGERGEIATYLSDYATDFYADNNTSYAQLSALSGGSTEKAVVSSALYKELHNLMESNHDYETSYSATKDLFKYTDCQNGGGKISSFYSGTAIGPSWDGSWNREHTWPNSKGKEGSNGENDLMMLRPTSTSENSSRGNKAYGQSSGYYNPNSESNGKYDLRGDVARIVLYVYVRWEFQNTNYNPNGIFGTDGVIESKQVLLDWIEADPVDTWELGRNDAAESILGTRNVFVDYPELAFVLFNEAVPSDYTTPSGNADAVSYTITAQSNNTSWGTVSVSGKTINATPKSGYEVAGYEVLSGKATVTRSGNAFTVNAESDVKIQINFAARTQKTVKFSQDGVVSSQTVYSGDEITLPSYSGTALDGITFVGWTEQSMEETDKMPQYYPAGSKYVVTTNVTLYALFSKTVTDGGTSSNVFEKYTGALVEGDYIVTYEGGAMKAASTGANRLQIAEVDDSGKEMIVNDATIIWKLRKDGNYWTFYNESTGKYAAGTGVKNNAQLSSTLNDYARWTASGNTTFEFVNLGNDSKGVNPLLRKNPGIGFACYAKNTNVGGPNTLYKRVSGTIYYFTQLTPSCEHKYSSDCDINCDLCGENRNTDVEHQFNEDDVCEGCGFDKSDLVFGDVNSDGAINNKDLALLMQYLNEWDVVITADASDTNADGNIDNKDYALLMQYVNEWNVELGPKNVNEGPLVFL